MRFTALLHISREDKVNIMTHTIDIDAIAGERWFPKESSIIDDMKDLWGDWGVCSEVDELKAVLMRRPGKEIDNFDWEAARFKAPIDPELFRVKVLADH